MTSAGTILITGATGFIGRQLLQHLPPGRVRAALRRQLATVALPCESVVVGAIDGNTNWNSALQGVDCVVHLAAHVHVMKATAADARAFAATNVDGTRRLALAAAEQGVKRFVLMSSIKVNGERTAPTAPFMPMDTPRPADIYGMSKWRAEQELRRIALR